MYRHVGDGRFEITRRLSDDECGALLGMTRQAVQQTEDRALFKLALGLLRDGGDVRHSDRARGAARVMKYLNQQAARQRA